MLHLPLRLRHALVALPLAAAPGCFSGALNPPVDASGDRALVDDRAAADDTVDAQDDAPAPDAVVATDAVDVVATDAVDAPVMDADPATDVLDASAPDDVAAATDVVVAPDVVDVPALDSPDVVVAPDVVDVPMIPDAGCAAPRVQCAGRCVDVRADAEHCGRCGSVCAAGSACSAGACSAVTQLAAGAQHTCALLADGTVACWGHDEFGQIGDGAAQRFLIRARPTAVQGLSGVAEIAAGTSHTCARLRTGAVRCWGRNATGALGNGRFSAAEPTPVAVSGITNAIGIAAGGSHTCAALADGSVRCWGSDASGQLGDGLLTGNRNSAVSVSGITTARGVVAGANHSCAWLADGSARCWGSNGAGQLGNGVAGNATRPVTVSSLTTVTALVAGANHTCALRALGDARCWGDNTAGQLGDGSTTSRTTPVAVAGTTLWRELAAGASHTCARDRSDAVHCWGTDSSAQLGDGFIGLRTRMTPSPVVGLGPALSVVAGELHACARLRDGGVRCWGNGLYGQLGNDAASGYRTAQAVPGVVDVAQVIARDNRTCARLRDGSARCWGQGSSGELGDGTTGTGRYAPAAVTGIANVTEIAGGSFHTCARLTDGTARCWGANTAGQIGDNTVLQRPAPTAVMSLRDASALALGQTSSCALMLDRTVRCWGANTNGRLGLGTEDALPHPLVGGAVMRLANATSLGAGLSHVCAVRGDGSVMCWGANDRGQLGDGTTASRAVATLVPALSNVTQVTGGAQHACARRGDGTVWCWGYNASAQCGLPTAAMSAAAPTQVAGIADAQEVSAGEHFTCARRGDGTVWCWGNNDVGQLGEDGVQFTASPTPLRIPGVAGATAIATGAQHGCALLGDGTLRCWGSFHYGALGVGHLFPVRF